MPGVYPRPRGGALPNGRRLYLHHGLSPPTRGSPKISIPRCPCPRSIPAHAGEPPTRSPRCCCTSVYPRPRGGACVHSRSSGHTLGLSPPTRGSHIADVVDHVFHGSIPAHAGEPPLVSGQDRPPAVYPRPRGGASVYSVHSVTLQGLSPPTRGSLSLPLSLRPSRRSIPAHAGEPTPETLMSGSKKVYPRPRGGAFSTPGQTPLVWGLSPPTRGSRNFLAGLLGWKRSIPAHAGEPFTYSYTLAPCRVYPRPRGGAASTCINLPGTHGLSPPTRGSLLRSTALLIPPRSIPAHAGEPYEACTEADEDAVYPRPRGGADRALAWDLTRRVYPRPRGGAATKT